MIVLLSPAKTLDMDEYKTKIHTIPRLLERTEIIADILKGYSPSRLADLMRIGIVLARLNAERYIDWELPFTTANAKQSIFVFAGEVYRGLNATSFTQQDLKVAQKSIRILSGLYGVLRPLDLMMPYRLEMGTPLLNPAGSNLYVFWRDSVTNCINEDLEQTKSLALINLASAEYFRVIDTSKIIKPIITPVFLETKRGKPRVVAVYAKKARGLMSAFIVKNALTNPEDLKMFDIDGYSYSSDLSVDNTWSFIR